jgi:hypothetical protein
MNLQNKQFLLIENGDGLAASDTLMIFDDSCDPFHATYSGPNVSNGHVLVSFTNNKCNMVYHALASKTDLVAGKAEVSFVNSKTNENVMQLNWQWLTGDLSSGISLWRQV